MKQIILLSTFILVFSASAWSSVVSNISIKCNGEETGCRYVNTSFSQLKGKNLSLHELRVILKKLSNIEIFEYLQYEISESENKFHIDVNVKLRLNIDDLSYEDEIKVSGVQYVDFPEGFIPPENIPLKKDLPLLEKDVRSSLSIITNLMSQQGYTNVILVPYIKRRSDECDVSFLLKSYQALQITSMNIISPNGYFRELLEREFNSYVGEVRNIVEMKKTIKEVNDYLIHSGFKLAELKLSFRFRDNEIHATLKLDLGPQIVINIISKEKVEDGIKSHLSDYMFRYKREITENVLKNASQEYLNNLGYIYSKVLVSKQSYKDIFGHNVIRYNISLSKLDKTRIEKVSFDGANFFSNDFLREHFYENSTDLISAGVYDSKYVEDFAELIKQEYYQAGYVGILVETPKIIIRHKRAVIKYRIREGVRARIKTVTFHGLKKGYFKELPNKMFNREDKYFNPISFEDDLLMIKQALLDQGLLDVKFNVKSNEMVTYSNENSVVNIRIEVKADDKFKYRSLFVLGNLRTRKKFFTREFPLENGDLITDRVLKAYHNKLLGFGLFSEIEIKLIHKHEGYADIMVQVREKNFGSIEVAFGYRTDLGVKLSTGIQYKNFDGMNKEVGLTLQVNQRLDAEGIDPERTNDQFGFVEYQTKVSYLERKILGSTFDFNGAISNSRQRFYAFDADISKLSLLLNFNISDWITPSLKLQQEQISQFNATFSSDNRQFQIGSLTPGIALDLRDDPIQPTKGAFLGLSWEIANPTFGSQNNEENEIDYHKITSRNKFYVPFKGGVLASSFTLGYQINNSDMERDVPYQGIDTVGYIPSIKVFRMVGIDTVRGYEDSEIGRLPSGEEISSVIITDKAYMVNIKIEPRFNISDALVWGVFYDAGRVFIDPEDVDSLRSSVGLTFKILTPVGTLDFDYGIKLLRKKDDSGNLETPGRLHVSIGFF